MGAPDAIIQAGKSNQISKVYAADAQLAHLRYWVRFLTTIRCVTLHQQQTSQVLIAEVGAMIGVWIKRKKPQGQAG